MLNLMSSAMNCPFSVCCYPGQIGNIKLDKLAFSINTLCEISDVKSSGLYEYWTKTSILAFKLTRIMREGHKQIEYDNFMV